MATPNLTPEVEKLLEALEPQAGQTHAGFERLWQRMVLLCRARGAPSAEDCAAETLARLVQTVAAQKEIRNPKAFIAGVARRIVLESLRQRADEPLDESSPRRGAGYRLPEVGEGDPVRTCLERCLDRLSEGQRGLIIEYFETGEKPESLRSKLRRALGISPQALVLRVFRIKRRLEKCTRHCVEQTLGSSEAK
jgi:DNA-directed RNA polymerase specialized sigma24 family protein